MLKTYWRKSHDINIINFPYRIDKLHSASLCVARRSGLAPEHDQRDNKACHLRPGLAPNPDLPGRHVHEPLLSDHVQAGRFLSRRAHPARLHPLSQQIGHRYVDVGRTERVSNFVYSVLLPRGRCCCGDLIEMWIFHGNGQRDARW